MHKILLHLKVWNLWRKYYLGPKSKILLVLFGLSDLPSFYILHEQYNNAVTQIKEDNYEFNKVRYTVICSS